MTVVAHFASQRSELMVVERPSEPQWEHGRIVAWTKPKLHEFHEHRYKAEGKASIDFLRSRVKAPNGPGVWELDATDVPEITTLLAELATASVERVRAILAAEEAEANRQVVVQTCREVLQRAGAGEHIPGFQPKTQPGALVG